MFPVIQKFSRRGGMNQFSFTLKLPHVLLLKSADKCLCGSLWYRERREERRGELAVSGCRQRGCWMWFSGLCLLTRLVYVQLHIIYWMHASISEHFCFPGRNEQKEPNVCWILGEQSNGDHSTSWCRGAWHLRTHPVSVRNRETPESPEKQE